MKTIISKTLALVIAATMFSFSTRSPSGGEGFEILIDGKTVLQKFGGEMDKVSILQLSKVSPTDKFTIKYHHCGRVGKNRIVTVKDSQDNTLKLFKFPDVSTPVGDMSYTIQDLMNLQKSGNASFKIYYSSTELPGGRQLASVILPGSNKVQP